MRTKKENLYFRDIFVLLSCECSELIEKNRWKLNFQWIFVGGDEWKSYFIEMPTICDFQSTPINKYSLKVQFSLIFSDSVLWEYTWSWAEVKCLAAPCRGRRCTTAGHQPSYIGKAKMIKTGFFKIQMGIWNVPEPNLFKSWWAQIFWIKNNWF